MAHQSPERIIDVNICFFPFDAVFLRAHLTLRKECTPTAEVCCTAGLGFFFLPFLQLIFHDTLSVECKGNNKAL